MTGTIYIPPVLATKLWYWGEAVEGVERDLHAGPALQFIVMSAWPGLWISIRARERGSNTHTIKGVLGLGSLDDSLSVPWLCLGACL